MKYDIYLHREKKEPRRTKLLYLIFLLFLSLFLLLVLLIIFLKKKPPEIKKKDVSQQVIPDKPFSPQEIRKTVQQGMTLTDILAPYGFSPGEIFKLREDVRQTYDLAQIKTNHEFRIFTSQEGEVISMEYDIDEEKYLFIQRKEDAYKSSVKRIPYEIKAKMVWGTIENNLITAVARRGGNDYLAISLAELFAWDIDFYTDIRPGDSFKIIFEKKYRDNRFVGYRNILAAEFINQGKIFHAFRFTYPDTTKSDYFDLEGNSLRKEFLKSPIKFASITSRFSYNRLHPIRKIFRPHYGVDYAARVGTPVQATAEGSVIFAGWKGASGRMVRIRHNNTYETLYLHLKNFAPSIRKGVKVKGGQVIGYVGSSGDSTGPHLDYRIKYRDKYINPLSWRFKPVAPLRQEFLADYKKEMEIYSFALEAPLIFFSSLSF